MCQRDRRRPGGAPKSCAPGPWWAWPAPDGGISYQDRAGGPSWAVLGVKAKNKYPAFVRRFQVRRRAGAPGQATTLLVVAGGRGRFLGLVDSLITNRVERAGGCGLKC